MPFGIDPPKFTVPFVNSPINPLAGSPLPALPGSSSTNANADAAVATALGVPVSSVSGSSTTAAPPSAVTSAKPGHPGHILTGTHYGLRHFIFVLKDEISNDVRTVELNINPEDLTFDTPYRVNAVQTLGGAFVDVWGQGIRRIVMRGHTGWRTVQTKEQQHDGFDNFFALKQKIVEHYFKKRNEYSPIYPQKDVEEKLTLTLVDRLHQNAYRVIPETHRMLRNKARPLLHMYELALIVMPDDHPEDFLPFKQNSDVQIGALFGSVTNDFNGLASKVANIGGTLGDFLRGAVAMGQNFSKTMNTLLKAKAAITNEIHKVAQTIHETVQAIHTGMGQVQSFLDLSGVKADIMSVFWDVKSVLKGFECLLEQIRHGGLFVYTGLVGTSYCSMPLGSPVDQISKLTNTFETLKSSNNDAKIQQITNGISVKGQINAQKILAIDTPARLIGRG